MKTTVTAITRFCALNNCTLEDLIAGRHCDLKKQLVRTLIKQQNETFHSTAEILKTTVKMIKYYYYSPLFQATREDQIMLLKNQQQDYEARAGERMEWINCHHSNHPDFEAIIRDRTHFNNLIAEIKKKIAFLQAGKPSNGMPDGPDGAKINQSIFNNLK